MKRSLLGLALVLTALVTVAPAAQASCVFVSDYEESLDEAPILFVGTVDDVTNGDRTATVTVDEVWKGDVPRATTVIGGAVGENTASSVDRTYRLGRRYLFAPYERDRANFQDNACTPTRVFGPRLERFRPADALIYAEPSEAPAPGEPGEPTSAGDEFPWVPIAAAALVVGLAVLVIVRRRGPT
jgi:hypothetical protein